MEEEKQTKIDMSRKSKMMFALIVLIIGVIGIAGLSYKTKELFK
jgi:hypothetical protein